eukprot:CAMPEP_0197289748 /NCGR_PEP_ID=MMETSP0890-20130614/7019_1 /TAXON_ID=44058 ORGANISM="Aureoumbra lagunensis, Strain CCMP1510" /NCGR_SAMPLE_ID=MMETSP0890 /ASSEMBLY_ACC=CAM_ASM_000533 /LENGTH=308 /DNA_ID=CAMNT_0042761353 /DNA_START=133 /DNA_END=1059 /DNA_ORIENTATION=+
MKRHQIKSKEIFGKQKNDDEEWQRQAAEAAIRHRRQLLEQMAKYKEEMIRLKREHEAQRKLAEQKRAFMEEEKRKNDEALRAKRKLDDELRRLEREEQSTFPCDSHYARAAEEELERQRKKVLERERLRAQQLRERARQERLEKERQKQYQQRNQRESAKANDPRNFQYAHHSSQHKKKFGKTPFPSATGVPQTHYSRHQPQKSSAKSSRSQNPKKQKHHGIHKPQRLANARHFRILELDPNASTPDIKGAFRRLAKTMHPDKTITASPGTQQAKTDKFLQIKEAYEALKDPASRHRYMALVAQGQEA